MPIGKMYGVKWIEEESCVVRKYWRQSKIEIADAKKQSVTAVKGRA